MKLVYIAGPFRAGCAWDVEQNVRRAESVAMDVWRLGAVGVCPHSNTRFGDGAIADEVWLEGYLTLLGVCDAMVLVGDWRSSEGTVAELELARRENIPVFESVSSLAAWLEFEAAVACVSKGGLN